MRISPHEQERLTVRVAAQAAHERMARGLKLNYPEAVAVLTEWVLERARDGRRVADLMQAGRQVLSPADVLDGVAALISEVQVEATFPDGTKLVTLHDPIPGASGLVPGEITGPDDEIEINVGRPVTTTRVVNTGDRPIQVGSHYHFAEANSALEFDRTLAHGQRLDVPAGTAVRFEPGIAHDIDLVPFVGRRVIPGLRGQVGGPLDDDKFHALTANGRQQ
ncbi:MAG: urease subunit gamma/beta [Candidatus Poriferisodalaceae bacterium]|jgi:urease subunit gamma/beta